MAATNFTPIILYHTTTASAAPTAGNLNNGELAINITDGKLFYKDNGGTVQVIATKGTGTIGGSNTQVQYNSSGALAGSANFTFNGTTATINTLNLTNALGTTHGGTGLNAYTTGDLVYASGTNTLAKLGIGLNTYILTSTGSVPQWSAPSAVTVATATNLAGGAAGSVPYQSGASTTTFLSIGTANTVMTSSGTAPQWSSSLTLGGNLVVNGNTTLGDAAADNLTVNATITSNMIFTDATYDIGASGATRPRNLYLSGGSVMGGNLAVTGTGTFNNALTVSTTGANALINVTTSDATQFSVLQLANTGASGKSWQIGVGGNTASSYANQFYLYDVAAGVARLQATTSGYIGIGITPVDKLTVNGAMVSTASTTLTTTNAAIVDYASSSGRFIAYNSGGSYLEFWANISGDVLRQRMTIDGLGRIGVNVLPQSWGTSQSIIELGGGGAWNASNTVGGTMSMTSNAYFSTSSTWLRRATGYAARIDVLGSDGSVALQNSYTSDVAGSTITWDNSVTYNRNNQLLLTTTNSLLGGLISVSTPGASQYSVLQLQNTGASGRIYQVGVGGSTATPANQFYIYDGTPGTGAIRMAINSSGQIGFGTTNQGAFMHLYAPNADGSSMLIENGGNNDCGIRTKTALGDYKFGTGIGTATNSFTIYDIAASAQRFRIGVSGLTTVGTSTSSIAKLAVQVSSSDGNLADWGDGQFVVTRGTDTRGNGFGVSFNDADSSVYLSALQPSTAWRNMGYRALSHNFYTTGNNLAATIDSTYKQLVVPNRHMFFASGPQGTNQPSGTVLIFSGSVPFNVGSRYNSVNGRFTAAVAGVYQFCHTALTFNVTNYFYAQFYVNGVAVKCAWHTPQNPSATDDYQSYSISMTYFLSVGDYVEVATLYNGGTPYVEGGAGGRTSFSGCLIG